MMDWAKVKEILTLVFNYFIDVFKYFEIIPEDFEIGA